MVAALIDPAANGGALVGLGAIPGQQTPLDFEAPETAFRFYEIALLSKLKTDRWILFGREATLRCGARSEGCVSVGKYSR